MRSDPRPAAWAIPAVFILITVLAVAGALLFVLQERGRLRLVAEYRAYQIVSELAQAYGRGDAPEAQAIDGLVGFGIYTPDGQAEYRQGEAPLLLADPKPTAPAEFSGGVISFVRALGGGPLLRGRAWALPELGEAAPDTVDGGAVFGGGSRRRMMMPMPDSLRLVYVAYRTEALTAGERSIYLGGGLVGAALLLTAGLFFVFYRRLEAYRKREAHNRELVALGEAARTLAHEIKNPLGVLKIQCALLRKTAGEGAVRSVAVIEEETERLNYLVGRIREFLGNAAGQPERVDLVPYLSDLAERYADAVAVAAPDPACRAVVNIDRGQLDRIVGNLIANARESADPPCRAEIALGAARYGTVVLEVADRGRGIPNADAERIYDLFYTTKASGSGLGLALARRAAEAAGGSLRHEDRKGGGTVFLVTLPLARNGGAA